MTSVVLPLLSRMMASLHALVGPASEARVSGRAALALSSVGTNPLMETTRQAVFAALRPVAERHGLHVAPEVSLAAVFTIHGAAADSAASQRALRHKRVDFLLIDGAARPVLAIDCCDRGEWHDRALRRDRLKRQAFEKAHLPLLALTGGPALDDDIDHVDALLRDLAREGRAGHRAA